MLPDYYLGKKGTHSPSKEETELGSDLYSSNVTLIVGRLCSMSAYRRMTSTHSGHFSRRSLVDVIVNVFLRIDRISVRSCMLKHGYKRNVVSYQKTITGLHYYLLLLHYLGENVRRGGVSKSEAKGSANKSVLGLCTYGSHLLASRFSMEEIPPKHPVCGVHRLQSTFFCQCRSSSSKI